MSGRSGIGIRPEDDEVPRVVDPKNRSLVLPTPGQVGDDRFRPGSGRRRDRGERRGEGLLRKAHGSSTTDRWQDLADELAVIDTGLTGTGIGVGTGGENELPVPEGDEPDHTGGCLGGIAVELEELVRPPSSNVIALASLSQRPTKSESATGCSAVAPWSSTRC